MAKLSSRMHSSESKEIPRVVVCHFPHKFDSLPLKRGSSASVSPRYLTSEPHPPSIISTHRSSAPAVAACWRLWWRRKACGSPTASEREEEDEYDDYGSAQEEEGGYAQSDSIRKQKDKKRSHRDHCDQSDTEESPTKAPKAARTSTHRSSTVSESSSLTDSHATASQSSRSSSQSAPRPRQSTTNGGKKGKKKHRRHPIEHRPNPPESPLDDSSHSRSDLRRIHRIQHRMVRKTRAAAKAALEAAAGESGSDSDSPSASPSSASRSSSSRSRRKPTPRGTIGGGPRSVGGQKSKDGSSRKRKGHQDDSDDDASQSGSEASQCEGFTMPSPKQIKSMTKRQLVAKLREQEKQHSQQLVAASAAPPNKKVAAVDMTHWEGIPINFGDPNDEKCPMWRALFRTTRDKVYRIRKFINKESQVEPLCHLVMDHSDIPWLTLTGNKKVDVSKYPIVLITLPIDLCTLQISYHLPPFLYHQRSSSFASSSVLFGRIRPAACSTRCATMCRVRPSTR